MQCVNCGAYLPDGTKFCPNCGCSTGYGAQVPVQSAGYGQQGYYTPAPVRSAPAYGQMAYDPVGSRQAVRQSEMGEVNNMIAYFSQKSALYDEYDRLCERLDPRYRRKRVGLLVWGIIISFLGLLVWAVAASGAGSPLFGILILLGGVTMIILFIVTSSSRNKNYAAAYQRFDQVSNELYEHYLNYGPCLVSAEYTNPNNLYAIMDTMNSGRADTIKEAVNILVEDAHRNNMELYARQTAISADNAARGARTAAVFAAANFFLRR